MLKGFSHKWTPIKTKPTITKDGYFMPRKWQEDGFYLIGERRRIINCPMGAGKSMFTKFISTKDMMNNKKEKTIIAVPQTQIAEGFRESGLEFPDGHRVDWTIDNQNDLMSLEGKISSRAMTDRAIDFLKSKTIPGHLSSRVLLCSHATLVNVYKRLKKNNDLKLLGNVSVFIDEAHHVKNAQFEVEGDEEHWLDQNELGKFVEFICSKKNSRLTLITATFFRGDRLGILPNKLVDKFIRCDLPFDEYFRQMKHLKSFSFDFLVYKACPTEAIKELFDKKIGKTIIHIPHVASKFSTGDKNSEVERIINTISDGRFKRTIDDIGNVVVRPKKRKKNIVIVDLVDDGPLREKRKKYIDEHSKSKSGPDVIIALGMFKEGANYDYADRSIIVGAKNSLTEMVQIIGRLFRDAKGKSHVSIYQLLPQRFDNEDSDEFKSYLNDLLKAILSSMLLENVLTPKFAVRNDEGEREGELRGERRRPFNDLFSDEQNRLEALRKIVEKAINNRAENGEVDQRENFDTIVDCVLKSEGICNYDLEEVSDSLWNMLSARTMQMDGIDVSTIDMDLLKKADPLGWIVRYTSAICEIDTFDRLRTYFSDRKTVEEHVCDAEKLAEENGGKLKGHHWLRKNGYAGLSSIVYKYPEKFSHIEQDNNRKTVSELVFIAEKLAKENGEKLPNQAWLRGNGYGGLESAICNYPEKFSHIEQESKVKTVGEWVAIAEKLAKENGAKLPTSSWLRKNGYGGIYYSIINNPNKFFHINKEKNVGRGFDEWVSIAEKLAKENGGKLPNCKWLKDNGYSGIVSCIYKYPEKFSHIERENFLKNLDEWVSIAEKLAKENGGKLQGHSWLKTNGYGGLSMAIYKDSESFSHINQENGNGKTVEEWITIAEELSKNNGGKLPNFKWLKENGYIGLYCATNKYPEKFSHIIKRGKRTISKKRTINEWINIAEKLTKENGGVLPSSSWRNQNGYSSLWYHMKKQPDKFKHIKTN